VGNHTVAIRFTINGEEKALEIPAGISALMLVRDILGLKGTKEGCGIGECGACTIVVDGKAVNACLMFAAQLDGCRVQTVEGLAKDDELDPVQEAFLEKNAVQCGYCTPGLLMSTHALLQQTPDPDEQTIRRAVAGNLCRCTGYQSILAAVEDAARRSRSQKED
jgi:carbon-monoxide dehydrogenase small subunit